jgi:hypothetical protein
MTFTFREDRDQHVGAGDFFAARRLDMDHRPLDDSLESGCRLGILVAVRDQVFKFGLDVFDQVAPDRFQVDIAGPHDSRSVLIVQQGQQEMLQGRILLLPFVGEGQSLVERFFKTA